jgi:hypothetical protein
MMQTESVYVQERGAIVMDEDEEIRLGLLDAKNTQAPKSSKAKEEDMDEDASNNAAANAEAAEEFISVRCYGACTAR